MPTKLNLQQNHPDSHCGLPLGCTHRHRVAWGSMLWRGEVSFLSEMSGLCQAGSVGVPGSCWLRSRVKFAGMNAAECLCVPSRMVLNTSFHFFIRQAFIEQLLCASFSVGRYA